MKKALSILLILTFIAALSISVSAADPLAEKFCDALDVLDLFYEYDAFYMYITASQDFISWADDAPKAVKVPAADFEAALHKYFVIDGAMIAKIRAVNDGIYYNKDDNTYTAEWLGGFGGSLPDREYLGYVKKGDTYEVYYRNLTYGFLEDVLPEGTDEYDYAEALDWPQFIEYNGVKYEAGMDGYCAILSRNNFGRKYTVEMNGDVVRIISCVDYKEGEQPDSFDDNKAPETTVAPETTKTPETTKAPETTKVPETTKAPDTTKAPETTKTPDTTKAPDTTKVPDTTVAPETEEPKSVGCGSVVGGTAIFALVGIAVITVRKKED